jgi:hypothetical protein
VAFAIENQTYSPLLAIYQLDGGSTQAVITYLPPKPEAFYQIRNLVSDETLFLSHQGTLTLQNSLKDNSAMILIFEEISPGSDPLQEPMNA